MQPKRIVFIIIVCVVIASISLFIIPVHRTYRADIVVNADNLITSRTLSDTTNWDKWYYNVKPSAPSFSSFGTSTNKKYNLFDYDVKEGESLKKGQIQLLRSKWDSKITWIEDITIEKGFAKKLELLLHPSQFRAPFLQNMVQFKNHIEHPDKAFGGLTFERTEIPSNKIIAAYDTVTLSTIEEHISALYKKIVSALPADKISTPGTFLSQYEKLDDSTMQLCVGVEVSDEVTTAKKPFELMDVDGYPAIIIHTLRNYTDMNDDVAIMYEWLKKNDARPATSYWVKHDVSKDVAGVDKKKLTIIQGIYLLNQNATK
ncbi:MAG: hypothetical protein QM802_16890 [Agriterribacter sp.]